MRAWVRRGIGRVRAHPFPVAVVAVGAAAVVVVGLVAQSETAVLWAGGAVGVLAGMAIAATTGRGRGGR